MKPEKQVRKMSKKAEQIRKEFREKYSNLARKFNELCLEMDEFLGDFCDLE